MYRLLVDICLDPFLLLFAAVMVAAANLWRKPRARVSRILLLSVTLVALLLVCTPAVAHLAVGSLESQFPPAPGERPDDAQALVVLSGGLTSLDDQGTRVQLSPDTYYRCRMALRLYRQGDPIPIVASGGKVDPDRPGPTLAAAMRDFLVSNGVDADDVIVEEQSSTTFENAMHSADLLQRRHVSRFVLITDAIHLPRAARCFRRQGLVPTARASRRFAESFRWELRSFLPSPTAARHVKMVVHEWVGLAWYRLTRRL